MFLKQKFAMNTLLPYKNKIAGSYLLEEASAISIRSLSLFSLVTLSTPLFITADSIDWSEFPELLSADSELRRLFMLPLVLPSLLLLLWS